MSIKIISFGYLDYFGDNVTSLRNLIDKEFAFEHKCEIINFNPNNLLPKKGLKYVSKASKILSNTILQIINKNSSFINNYNPDSIATYNGSDYPNLEEAIEYDLDIDRYGPDLLSPLKAPFTLSSMPSHGLLF